MFAIILRYLTKFLDAQILLFQNRKGSRKLVPEVEEKIHRAGLNHC